MLIDDGFQNDNDGLCCDNLYGYRQQMRRYSLIADKTHVQEFNVLTCQFRSTVYRSRLLDPWGNYLREMPECKCWLLKRVHQPYSRHCSHTHKTVWKSNQTCNLAVKYNGILCAFLTVQVFKFLKCSSGIIYYWDINRTPLFIFSEWGIFGFFDQYVRPLCLLGS